MDASWVITIALAVVVALVVLTEIRCGRRNKAFHRKIDPEIEKLQASVITKYREKFGREPTGITAALTEHPNNNGVAAKKA